MSRTDHARKPKNRSKRGLMQDMAQERWYDHRNPRVLSKQQEIAEQVALVAELALDAPASPECSEESNWEPMEEPLADWEKQLFGIPTEPVWVEDTRMVAKQPLEDDVIEDVEDAWDDKYGRDPFIPVMGIDEAYKHLGDDGWHIEGPTPTPIPVWGEFETTRKEHYLRVYEIAAACGVPSKDMVRKLRLSGEYVKTHMSLVAIPAAERLTEWRKS